MHTFPSCVFVILNHSGQAKIGNLAHQDCGDQDVGSSQVPVDVVSLLNESHAFCYLQQVKKRHFSHMDCGLKRPCLEEAGGGEPMACQGDFCGLVTKAYVGIWVPSSAHWKEKWLTVFAGFISFVSLLMHKNFPVCKRICFATM